jgi:hypothetical protein
VQRYHPDRFSVSVTLPATGCPTRENGMFHMSMWLSRVDEHAGEGHGRVVSCGPFPSSSTGGMDRWYACELDEAFPHPSPEAASYDVEVTYPGADGEETVEFHSHCTTGDDGAFCVAAEPSSGNG